MDLFAALAWLASLAASIKRLAQKHRVPFEVFERLVSREGEARLDRLIRMLMDEYLTEKRLLNHYTFALRGVLPVYDASMHEVGSLPWAVSQGRKPVWSRSRKNMLDGGQRESVTLYIHTFEAGWSLRDAQRWGWERGYVPATYDEAWAIYVEGSASLFAGKDPLIVGGIIFHCYESSHYEVPTYTQKEGWKVLSSPENYGVTHHCPFSVLFTVYKADDD